MSPCLWNEEMVQLTPRPLKASSACGVPSQADVWEMHHYREPLLLSAVRAQSAQHSALPAGQGMCTCT